MFVLDPDAKLSLDPVFSEFDSRETEHPFLLDDPGFWNFMRRVK